MPTTDLLTVAGLAHFGAPFDTLVLFIFPMLLANASQYASVS